MLAGVNEEIDGAASQWAKFGVEYKVFNIDTDMYKLQNKIREETGKESTDN